MLMRSVMFKLVVLGFLIGVLLVPLGLIWLVTADRVSRRDAVLAEVAGTWGLPQRIGGPVLSVPYIVISHDNNGREVQSRCMARFLPESLRMAARLDPEIRRRGIYEAPVYTARVTIAGTFARPDMQAMGVAPDAVRWNEATLSLALSDLKAVTPEFSIAWNGRAVRAEPDASGQLFAVALAAQVAGLGDGTPDREVPFEITLPMRGSRSLTFLPVGRQTTVSIASAWASPGFVGALLPDRRDIGAKGFSAEWRVSSFGRNVPHAWRDADIGPDQAAQRLEQGAFGVTLVTPVDIYQQTERSTKYAVLFVLLTFLAFFLVEMLRGVMVHPVQYLLTGAALCVFYLLLLPLAEQVGFALAYVVAASATIALIGGYSRSALRTRTAALQITAVLGALYGFLYVLLQIDDYALLVGSVALFLILAAVMFLTRKIDWYSLSAALQARPQNRS